MKIKAIIGLGNKGKQYEDTYHNVGILAVKKFKDLGGEIKFIIPNSYMNNIGLEVGRLLRKSGLGIEDCLVVHDDSDQSLGRYKIVEKGGSAGHKGIENLIQTFKTSEFPRLKIGIRKEDVVRKKAGEFVLNKINNTGKEELAKVFEIAWNQIIPFLNQS